MRIFKRTIISTVSFLMVSVILSAIIISASDNESQIIPDNTDYIFCGASNCEKGFIPDIIDKELGTHSYNLSILGLKREGKYELLKNVLPEFPIDTVALEVSFYSLIRGQTETGTSDMRAQRYLGNYIGTDYLVLKPFSLKRIQETYSGLMRTGFDVIWNRIRRCFSGDFSEESYRNYPKSINRGFEGAVSVDNSIPTKQIKELYKSINPEADFPNEYFDMTLSTINLCKENKAEVMVVVVPVSNAFIWKYNGFDTFYYKLKRLCNENGCNLYDFNLLKARYANYSDKDDFFDDVHLSTKGARQFSNDYSMIMKKVCVGEDISDYFYKSYAEMENDSPYMAYLKLPNN